MNTKPYVLFVCVHNAGRSQMAAAFLQLLAEGQVEVRSAGSMPTDRVNPAAVEAMREEGIDMSTEIPKILTTEAVQASDVVITMAAATPAPSSRANVTRTGNSMTPPVKAWRRYGQSAMRSAPALKPSSVNYFPCVRNNPS